MIAFKRLFFSYHTFLDESVTANVLCHAVESTLLLKNDCLLIRREHEALSQFYQRKKKKKPKCGLVIVEEDSIFDNVIINVQILYISIIK